MGTSNGALFDTPGGGSSAVFGPDGRIIASAESAGLSDTEEGIVFADLNMDDHLKARGFVDACGHYSRPDMLWLGVDAREKKHVRAERVESHQNGTLTAAEQKNIEARERSPSSL
jgi:nitrilase